MARAIKESLNQPEPGFRSNLGIHQPKEGNPLDAFHSGSKLNQVNDFHLPPINQNQNYIIQDEDKKVTNLMEMGFT